MSSAAPSVKVRKFPCAGCGGDVRWDPGAKALKCPFCGLEKIIAPASGSITEKPLDAGLRAPRDLGWGAERKVIACKRCGAHTTLEPHVAASACAFCGTSAVVEAPPNANIVRPEGVLPFRVAREKALSQFRSWISGLWFRPSDLKSRARMNSIKGAYIPFWTFDAATHSYLTAEAGSYYYEDVQVYENGQYVTKQERRTRWEPASGTLDHFFDDLPVPASRGIDAELSQSIEPFPTSELVAYEPSYLSGFLAEENAIDLAEAVEMAKRRMRGELYSACAREVPGDTHRDLEVQTSFSALAYKNALLPIWIAAYEYKEKPYRFLVNGVTGKAGGDAPWSWVKITLTLVTIIVIAVILYSMVQS